MLRTSLVHQIEHPDHFKRNLIEGTFDQLTKSQHEVLGSKALVRMLSDSCEKSYVVHPL